MISIKKDFDITLLVLAFFILSFFVFMLMKPQFTGMVTVGTLNINNIYSNSSLSGMLPISFSIGDVIPCTSNVTVIVKSSGNAIRSDTITLENFLSLAGSSCADSQIFNDADHTFTWETQTGRAFSPGTSVIEKAVNISRFTNITSIETTGTFSVDMFLIYSTDTIDTKTGTFTVTSPPSDINKPEITNVNFQNENGSSKFMITQYVNCSATVKDIDSSSVTVNYIMWGSNVSKTSITNPGKTGAMTCDSNPWSTGKLCSINIKADKSDLGYWNCTVDANDETNRNYFNSSVLLMINSPPRLKDEIDNITWEENENYTDLDLDSKFEDPDDQKLNYTAYNNDHVDITIKSNADVVFSPELNWTGTENIYFKARDEKGAEALSNNFSLIVTNLLNCTSSWVCGNWSVCVSSIRTRTCNDINNCTVKTSYQPTSENCTSSVVSCAANDGCMLDCVGGDPDCSCSVQNGYICGSSQNCTSSIIHSGIGTCCSAPCSQSINTLTNAGEGGGFFSEQKNKILIGFGTIVAVVFVIILIIVVSAYLKKKRAGVSEETPLLQETVKEEKPVEVSTVKIKPTNIDKMKDYIEQSLSTKVPIRIIKGELSKVGWTESDVDRELNIARLRNYIQIKLNQGIPRAQIEQSLRMKGWSQEQIDEASRNTKVRPLI